MANATGSIDAIFAGMPRSAAWPPDADEPPPTAPTLFDRAPDAPGQAQLSEAAAGSGRDGRPGGSGGRAGARARTDDARPVGRRRARGAGRARSPRAGPRARGRSNGARRRAVRRGRPALRARACGSPRRSPRPSSRRRRARARSSLLMVRGDAYRLAGHEDEAREAYLAAARGGLPERRRRSRTRPATDRDRRDGVDRWDGRRTDATSRAGGVGRTRLEEGVTDDLRCAAGSDGEADVHDASAETHGRRAGLIPAAHPIQSRGVQHRPYPRKTCQAPNEPSSSSSPTASSAS